MSLSLCENVANSNCISSMPFLRLPIMASNVILCILYFGFAMLHTKRTYVRHQKNLSMLQLLVIPIASYQILLVCCHSAFSFGDSILCNDTINLRQRDIIINHLSFVYERAHLYSDSFLSQTSSYSGDKSIMFQGGVSFSSVAMMPLPDKQID